MRATTGDVRSCRFSSEDLRPADRVPFFCDVLGRRLSMSRTTRASCKVVRPGDTYDGKQGFSYFAGIAKETVGSEGVCMHLLTIPPGGRAKAHKHENHETAIYVLSGESHAWFGERLEEHVIVRGGEMFYIPKGVPHLPANLSDRPCTAVIARTDANEQESVVLLPELDALVPEAPSPLPGAQRGKEVTVEGHDATTGDLK